MAKLLLLPLLTKRFSFIIDIKAMQPEIYQNYTGRSSRQAVENLALLCRQMPKEHYVVKLPAIPGYTGDTEIADSLKKLRALGIPDCSIATFRYTIV